MPNHSYYPQWEQKSQVASLFARQTTRSHKEIDYATESRVNQVLANIIQLIIDSNLNHMNLNDTLTISDCLRIACPSKARWLAVLNNMDAIDSFSTKHPQLMAAIESFKGRFDGAHLNTGLECIKRLQTTFRTNQAHI